MDPLPVIIIVTSIFVGFFAWIMGAVIWRGWKSSSSWARTTGCVKSFGVSNGIPAVTYEYEVNGGKFTGNGIVPGVLAGKSQGTKPAKSVYLRADGELKFPPKAEVDVFYDPKNPSDAALVTGIPPGLWKGPACILVIAGIAGGIYGCRAWADKHVADLICAAFVCCGVFLLGCSVKWLRDYTRSRSFPTTSGRLLKAEVAYSSGGGESGGYVPVAEFEYTVNGALYQSRQLTSNPTQVLKSRAKDVQPVIDRLRAGPTITVYYDPQAPWVGFLEHGSVLGALLPVFMGLIFAGVGVAMWLRFLRN